ncbi:hypothetical protein G6F58_013345 [Rhizopus delemar]|nr:hypothetical protein G6F58_013345 [Rhizopus delemar]
MNMINLTHGSLFMIGAFLAAAVLARTGSFVRAAELRHVTHPAFGRRIRALEAWAGAPLVERQHLPVTLTPEGEALLKTATQVVEQMGLVRHRIRTWPARWWRTGSRAYGTARPRY